MKVYYYSDKEVDGVQWPGPDADFLVDGKPKSNVKWPRFIWYDWKDFEETRDPYAADVFVMRHRLIWIDREQIIRLPHFTRWPHRHVFFDLGSDGDSRCFRDFPGVPALFIRAVCDKQMFSKNMNTISWPWPVDDFKDYVELPGGFRHDVAFQGQSVSKLRRFSVESLEKSDLDCHLVVNRDFYGTQPSLTVKREQRRTFLEGIQFARLSLCPRSNPRGVIPYRFYEALSMGRVPIFLGDDCIFPLADRIPYDDFVISIPESQACSIDTIITRWLDSHKDEEIIERGKLARYMWVKYLKRENWGSVINDLVKEFLLP